MTVQVIFTPVGSKEQTLALLNLNTMTFNATLKPGQYRIAVLAKAGAAPDTPDYFKGAYSPERTQILREIKAGEEIVIDLSKPQG